MFFSMTYAEDKLSRLDKLGVLDGIRWAFKASARSSWADYTPGSGYNRSAFGSMRTSCFEDRINKVFSLGPYSLSEGADATSSMDLVREGLTDKEFTSMPKIPSGLVECTQIINWHGWIVEDIPWMIQSFPDDSDNIDWSKKSVTKAEIASQQSPDDLVLFNEGYETIPSVGSTQRPVFVIAHSVQVTTGKSELWFGVPTWPKGWRWKEDILGGGNTSRGYDDGRGDLPTSPMPKNPSTVPDAKVRLRKNSERRYMEVK